MDADGDICGDFTENAAAEIADLIELDRDEGISMLSSIITFMTEMERAQLPPIAIEMLPVAEFEYKGKLRSMLEERMRNLAEFIPNGYASSVDDQTAKTLSHIYELILSDVLVKEGDPVELSPGVRQDNPARFAIGKVIIAPPLSDSGREVSLISKILEISKTTYGTRFSAWIICELILMESSWTKASEGGNVPLKAGTMAKPSLFSAAGSGKYHRENVKIKATCYEVNIERYG